jgi:membrane-bound lytic murein transglycosylase MltF
LPLLFLSCAPSEEETEAPAADLFNEDPMLSRLNRPLSGDLEEMKQRRFIRVLVTHSKTNYFIDGAETRGFEYEMLEAYEKTLNRGVRKETDRVQLVFIPVPFNRLLPALAEEKGDLAAAGITITDERKKMVDFTDPYIPRVEEVVVVNRDVHDLNRLSDLAGKEVYVRAGCTYAPHLEALSESLRRSGHRAIRVKEASRNLATEDILELVNAGILKWTVADRHIAEIWSGVFQDIVIRDDLVISTGNGVGWAVRPDCPGLLADLNRFIRKNRKGSLLGNILFKRYFQDIQWIKNPLTRGEQEKLDRYAGLLKKYAAQYGFDWLALAALAYQESELNHDRVSRAGAVGVMQMLPRTAADKSVGIPDIRQLENNIHAGAKYLHHLRETYFSGPEIDPAIRMDFAWAAYNAGPTRIVRLRSLAADRGLDPNRWFYHVEKVAAEVLGRETVRYVSNINKYYIAYRLYYESSRRREAEWDAMKNEAG